MMNCQDIASRETPLGEKGTKVGVINCGSSSIKYELFIRMEIIDLRPTRNHPIPGVNLCHCREGAGEGLTNGSHRRLGWR